MTDLDWTVHPHDPPVQLAEGLWRVEGDLPNMALRRAMTVAALPDGELLIHNAVALDDAGMTWLEGLGKPTWLIVPNGWHRMDCGRFKARYPDLKVVCPPGSRKKIEQKVAVDFTSKDAPIPGGQVTYETVDGVKGIEAVLKVARPCDTTLVFNDLLFNLPHMKGLFGLVYGRLMGNAGGPKITTIGKLFMVKDKAALRAHLQRLAETPDLKRLIPGHGRVMEDDPGGILRGLI
ncbi:MAG: hypothetical protein H6702_13075 [Myxococcales bacterium]|nr:hypothetical protein [Myxococcales bacterium]